jgi:hypothetical protein
VGLDKDGQVIWTELSSVVKACKQSVRQFVVKPISASGVSIDEHT